jgi:hypothetical protein
MAILDLSTVAGVEYSEGIDGTAIKHYVHGIEGGGVLNVTGFADAVIYEGHGVIREDSTGEYKPLPTTGTIPASHTLVGVVRSTTLASKPAVGIMTQGTINNNVVKYPFSAANLLLLKAEGVYNQID